MTSLRQLLTERIASSAALGHFNVATLDTLRAVVRAAETSGKPVIIGASEGERDAFGISTLVAIIENLKKTASVPIFLNADHTYSVDRVKEAIDAGFDMVIFDGAKLPFEENIAGTKACVEYARASGRDIIVEAELGFIGSGSQMLDEVPEGAAFSEDMMTSVEEAQRFVEETGVDAFAPAVGNIHGMLKGSANPRLSPTRIKAIAEAVGVPLVLHGGSGVSDEDFRAGIEAGIAAIHVSTELRRAYREGLEHGLAEHPNELAPYKYLVEAGSRVEAKTLERLTLFG